MPNICMICDKLRATEMSAKRDIYSDYYSSIAMKLEVEPDSNERNYFLVNSRYHDDVCSEYKIIIRYCPFCGKELI